MQHSRAAMTSSRALQVEMSPMQICHRTYIWALQCLDQPRVTAPQDQTLW